MAILRNHMTFVTNGWVLVATATNWVVGHFSPRSELFD